MKAAAKTAEGDYEIIEVPMPEITRPDYVLVKIRSAGICGSDLHRWKVPVPESVGRISGHELAGDVVAIGDDVTNVKVGDRVGVDSVVSCGECYWCKVGQYHICPYKSDIRGKTFARAFSEYVAGPSSHVFPIPDNVGYGEAAIMDVYGTSVHAINRLDIHMNQKVVIIGAGPIGLSLLDLVNVAGADGIIVDIIDHPLEFAKNTMGAYATINSKKVDPVAKVLELTDGLGADVVVDCVGGGASAFLLPQAVEMVRRRGKIGMVGMPKTDISFQVDWRKLQMGEVDLIGVSGFFHWGNDREFKIVTDLLSKGKLHATEMITHRFPLEQINEAFTVAADKQGTNSIKVVLDS